MTGRLEVQFRSRSAFLAETLPVEVRNGRNVLVWRSSGSGQTNLPSGEYLLRAVDIDGTLLEEELTITEGQRTMIELGQRGARRGRPSATERFHGDMFLTSPGDSALGPVEVVDVTACTVRRNEPWWIFGPVPKPTMTPAARFSMGERFIDVSLPVEAARFYQHHFCLAAATSTNGGDRIEVRFHPQRAVASIVDGMLRNDGVFSAVDLLPSATELLYGKYYDAPAAALGGLTLHRIGRVGDRPTWIENLARDFQWIPDGAVLLAALLARSRDSAERERGVTALLAAAERRPMFTDGYALMLQLLRRWPGGEFGAARQAALDVAVRTYGVVDWAATVFTTEPSRGSPAGAAAATDREPRAVLQPRPRRSQGASMTSRLRLQFLPANEGDAIWVRWGDGLRHQLLVDAGKDGAGTELRARLENLPKASRKFELFIVTHVDADHIGGVITSLVDPGPLDGLRFKDFWFNGWAHINRQVADLESMGGVQGELLTRWLEDAKTPWNKAFESGAVTRTSPLTSRTLADGMVVTVLGPPAKRFERLIPKWRSEVQKAIKDARLTNVSPGLEVLGGHRKPPIRPRLPSVAALERLASTKFESDTAPANGTSICVMLEWRGRRVLLTGDAYAPDIVDALQQVEPTRRRFDLVKLPHHGSEANTSDELLDAVRSPRWVFSSNGTIHYHPDAAAVARVIRPHRSPRPQLLFNEPSTYNSWWENKDWQRRFDYKSRTGTPTDGLTVELSPKDR
jgi:hypothetical protein